MLVEILMYLMSANTKQNQTVTNAWFFNLNK